MKAGVLPVESKEAGNPRYLCYPHSPAQSGCRHLIRTTDECAVCGSRKVGNRWVYLSPAWLAYYLDGTPRPPEVDDL